MTKGEQARLMARRLRVLQQAADEENGPAARLR
jgi:RecA/RadA recombinase